MQYNSPPCHVLVSSKSLQHFPRLPDLELFRMPDPSTPGPLTPKTFIFNLLHTFVLYYVTALLVLLPGAFFLRLVLLPVTLYALFCASTRIDIAKGFIDEQRLVYFNHALTARNLYPSPVSWSDFHGSLQRRHSLFAYPSGHSNKIHTGDLNPMEMSSSTPPTLSSITVALVGPGLRYKDR